RKPMNVDKLTFFKIEMKIKQTLHPFFLFFILCFNLYNLIGQQSNQRRVEPDYLWKNEPFGQFSQESEIISMRDENSKHFRNQDGSITAHVAAGKINYLAAGKWNTIFHTIEPTSSGFQNITNSFKTYYPLTSSGNITTVLEDGSTIKDMMQMRMYYEGYEPQARYIASKQGDVDFNKLTYSDVYGSGIDLQLTQQTTKRKMDYIIQNRSALLEAPSEVEYLIFEEKVLLPNGWSAVLSGNEIFLKDSYGILKAKYEKAIFHDSP